MSILYPDTHQKPPLGAQIDWSHPLADGLRGCWLFNEGTLPAYDITGLVYRSQLGVVGMGIGTGEGQAGLCITAAGNTTGYLKAGAVSGLQNSPWTIFVQAEFLTSAASIEIPVNVGDHGSAHQAITIGLQPGGTFWFDEYSDSVTLPIPGGFPGGRVVTLCMVLQPNLARNIYYNGIRVGGEGSAAGFFTGEGNVAFMNTAAAAQTGYAMKGSLYCAAIWNRALMASEAALLAASPYAFVRRPGGMPLHLLVQQPAPTVHEWQSNNLGAGHLGM